MSHLKNDHDVNTCSRGGHILTPVTCVIPHVQKRIPGLTPDEWICNVYHWGLGAALVDVLFDLTVSQSIHNIVPLSQAKNLPMHIACVRTHNTCIVKQVQVGILPSWKLINWSLLADKLFISWWTFHLTLYEGDWLINCRCSPGSGLPVFSLMGTGNYSEGFSFDITSVNAFM